MAFIYLKGKGWWFDVYVENLQWELEELTKEQERIKKEMESRSEIDNSKCHN